jgi:hypothetical protein
MNKTIHRIASCVLALVTFLASYSSAQAERGKIYREATTAQETNAQAPFYRRLVPGDSAGWTIEKSGAMEKVTAVSDGWICEAGGYVAPTHYARLKYKVPEQAGIVLTTFYMRAVIVLPSDFYTEQKAGFRLLNTDNFATSLNGVQVGAADSRELRTAVYIYSDHSLRIVASHEQVSAKEFYRSSTPLPVGEHILELYGSLSEAAPWYFKVDGVVVGSGVARLSPDSVPANERVATRLVTGIDGAADQDANLMNLQVKSFEIANYDIAGVITPSPTPPPATITATAAPTPTPTFSGPYVSTEVNPTSLNIGGTALVSVKLNNVPVEGYKSAEFTCTYDASLVEKSNLAAASLFGADPAVAIHDPQNGSFIVAIAGTNSNRALSSGPALTFSVKGLQAGQSEIRCAARVSKGDNVPVELPSTGASLTIPEAEPTPTPFAFPTLIPSNSPQPTATNIPLSPTPTSTLTPLPSPDGTITGQLIASKPVTALLLDANNVAITSVVANPDGTFSLTALAGNYTVVAAASGFLSHQGSATITAGNTTVLPTSTLLAGDIDGNNVIDQFDALTMGMNYSTASPSAADLNNDGFIDFLDLELLAENYRKTGPTVWQ